MNSAPLSYSADWLQLSESKSGQRAADLLLGSIGGAAALDLHTHFVHVRVHRTVEEKSVRQIAQLEEKVRDLKHKLIKATTSSSSSSRSTTVKKSSATLSSSSARRRKSNASATSVKPPKAENCNDDISLASASPPHEEYIPANPVTSSKAAAAPAVKYNPGRMADEPAHEPYVPYVPPETSPAGKATPAYNPSPNSSAEKPGPAATDKRSNRAASKKTDGKPKKSRRKRGYSTDLFESEEELEEQHVVLVQSSSDSTTGLARSARSARTRTAIHSCLDESLLSPRVSPTIKRSKPAAKATDKPPKRDGKKDAGRIRALNVDVVHRTAEPPSAANAYLTKLSDEQMDALSAKRKREMADMQRLRELLKPEPLPDIQVVDLKDTSLTEIEGTFAAHQPRLLAFFEAYCGGRMRQIVRPADMSEFAVNYLLNEQQQLHMVDILTKAFGGQENLSSVRIRDGSDCAQENIHINVVISLRSTRSCSGSSCCPSGVWPCSWTGSR